MRFPSIMDSLLLPLLPLLLRGPFPIRRAYPTPFLFNLVLLLCFHFLSNLQTIFYLNRYPANKIQSIPCSTSDETNNHTHTCICWMSTHSYFFAKNWRSTKVCKSYKGFFSQQTTKRVHVTEREMTGKTEVSRVLLSHEKKQATYTRRNKFIRILQTWDRIITR